MYSDHTAWLPRKEANGEQGECVYKTQVSEGAGEERKGDLKTNTNRKRNTDIQVINNTINAV